MEEKNISLNIADRIYRITVNNEQEEADFIEAARLINENINEYARLYEYKDKQDLVSMVALQFVINIIKNKKETANKEADISSKIGALTEMVDSYLKKDSSLKRN